MLKKILVIEDDTGVLKNVQQILEMEDYVVEAIHDAHQTFEKVYSFLPDLILIDVLLSGEDGRKICRSLKNNPRTQHIPILMMSAHPEAKESAKESGADGFIVKPYDIEELVKGIDDVIEASQMSMQKSLQR